jgi:hypothetical protein
LHKSTIFIDFYIIGYIQWVFKGLLYISIE